MNKKISLSVISIAVLAVVMLIIYQNYGIQVNKNSFQELSIPPGKVEGFIELHDRILTQFDIETGKSTDLTTGVTDISEIIEGKFIYTRDNYEEEQSEIWLLNVTGGESKKLVSYHLDLYDYTNTQRPTSPLFNGQSVTFFLSEPDGKNDVSGKSSIVRLDLETLTTETLVSFDYAPQVFLLDDRDGDLLYAQNDGSFVSLLDRHLLSDTAPKELKTVTTKSPANGFIVSPSRRYVLAQGQTQEFALDTRVISVYDRAKEEWVPLPNNFSEFLSKGSVDESGQKVYSMNWADDSDALYFASEEGIITSYGVESVMASRFIKWDIPSGAIEKMRDTAQMPELLIAKSGEYEIISTFPKDRGRINYTKNNGETLFEFGGYDLQEIRWILQ